MKHASWWGLALLATLFFCSGTQAGNVTKHYPANDPAVRYIGRTQVQADGSVSFDWVGTYLETGFTGGTFSVRLSETGTSYYNVFVDGSLHRVVKACGKDTVIDFVTGVSRKLHSLRIQKRTEGEFGRTTIQEFRLAASGLLQAEPRTRSRHIEFIGNSLTCGYGVEGADRNEPFRLETENCDLAYAVLTARYFDADYTLIAHSGRGAARNYGDSLRVSAVTMREKMLQTFDTDPETPWDFSALRPDLVVINLGTNDFSVEPHPYKSEFVASYTRILRQLRQRYGQVPILCLFCCTITAPVYSYYEAALAEMDDPDIHLLALDRGLLNSTTDMGAVWHPNRTGQRKMAMNIIPYVATLMGWEVSNL